MIVELDITGLLLQCGTDPDAAALFSAGELHRYVLQRRLRPRPELIVPGAALVACGINPSTANAFKVDPTVKREIGWAMAWGCEWYIKINAYAWRETKPAKMWAARRGGADIEGARNDVAIFAALALVRCRPGSVALAAWGVGVEAHRAVQLQQHAAAAGVRWQCAAYNGDGSPAHPLIRRKLRADGAAAPELQPWPRAA